MRKKKETFGAEIQPSLPAPQPEAAAATPAAPEYPYLKEPAEPGGVIIGTDDHIATTPMTKEDIDAAHEQMFFAAEQLRLAEAKEHELIAEEKRNKAALDGTREALRKEEQRQLALGRELATYAEEIKTGERKITIKVAETVTKGNELVITDGRTGKEISRRTATAEEVEWSTGKAGSLFSPPVPPGPQDEPVTVSVLADAYKRLKKTLRGSLSEIFRTDDADPDAEAYNVVWQKPDAEGRSCAIVPRWVASRLRTITEPHPQLEYKIHEQPDPAALA